MSKMLPKIDFSPKAVKILQLLGIDPEKAELEGDQRGLYNYGWSVRLGVGVYLQKHTKIGAAVAFANRDVFVYASGRASEELELSRQHEESAKALHAKLDAELALAKGHVLKAQAIVDLFDPTEVK